MKVFATQIGSKQQFSISVRNFLHIKVISYSDIYFFLEILDIDFIMKITRVILKNVPIKFKYIFNIAK